MPQQFTFSLMVEITDPQALHAHAFEVCTASPFSMDADETAEWLGAEDDPRIDACLVALFDPGAAHPYTDAVQVVDSGAEPTAPGGLKATLEPVTAAAMALETHHRAMRLEDGNPPSTALWHLLLSLLQWADAQEPRVDFDATLSEVRQHIAEVGA